MCINSQAGRWKDGQTKPIKARRHTGKHNLNNVKQISSSEDVFSFWVINNGGGNTDAKKLKRKEYTYEKNISNKTSILRRSFEMEALPNILSVKIRTYQ